MTTEAAIEEAIVDPTIPGEPSDQNPWSGEQEAKTAEATSVEAKPEVKAPPPEVKAPVVAAAPTATEIARAVAEGIKNGNAPATKPLTEAEQAAIYEKTFGVVKPTIAQIEQLYKGGEDAVNAMHTMVQTAVKQAVLMATYLANESIAKIDSKYAPTLTIAEQYQSVRLETEFAKEHPDLMEYKPLLQTIRDKAVKAGIPFKTEAEAKTYVADEARAILKSMNIVPQAKTNGASGAVVAKTTGKTKMVTTSTGGQSGSKGAGSASNDSNDPETLARSLFS